MSSEHASVGSYATDALDPAEVADVEGHLAECEVCRSEFDEFSETAAELTRLVATAPPTQLRSAVLRSIASVRPLPPDVSTGTPSAALHDELDRAGAGRNRRGGGQSARLLRFPTRALVGVAAAAIACAVAAGGYAVNTQHELVVARTAQSDGSRERAVAQQETAILQAPDAVLHTSRLQDGNSVSYLVSKSRNAAMMISPELADPGSGKTYQMWTVVRTAAGGTAYRPDRTFSGGTDQRVFLSGDVADAVGIAITVEPTGGSTHPSSEPDARASL